MNTLKKNIIENLTAELNRARKEVNTNPTDPQKKAGNYKMGHVNIHGYNISIENPKGSYRCGTDENGHKWRVPMHNDYGYFKHTLGRDGDAIDVFIGNNLDSEKIFVVDQYLNGKFDESKVMLCFDSAEQARSEYLKNYENDWSGNIKHITQVSNDVFKKWLYDGYKQRKPFYQYVEIKKNELKESIIRELQAYHGSRNKFNQFRLMYCGENLNPEFGHGIYLTTDKNTAYNYMNDDGESYLYYVEIPEPNGENYISYNDPITSRQFMEIIMSLNDEEYDELVSYGFKEECAGIVVYNALSKLMGSDEETSEFLTYCDIIGMQYPDVDDHSIVNYVIFDENAVQIVNKETIE